VDNGAGRTLYEGTTSERRRFRGRRLRLNLGRPSALVRLNGRRVEFPSTPDPVGYDFRPGRRAVALPPGRRPCA
jgi:hypothetical protein